MVSSLITALVAMTIVCLLFGWACYRLFTDGAKSMEHEASRCKEWMDEKKKMGCYLSGVLRVLNSNIGGSRN